MIGGDDTIGKYFKYFPTFPSLHQRKFAYLCILAYLIETFHYRYSRWQTRFPAGNNLEREWKDTSPFWLFAIFLAGTFPDTDEREMNLLRRTIVSNVLYKILRYICKYFHIRHALTCMRYILSSYLGYDLIPLYHLMLLALDIFFFSSFFILRL